ncbi:THO complex subunit 3 [Rosa chinensis]|uniref:THO complex subunit 3 n=1 Tax=Rosa chinensis TaxID=74649 RepID=UPI001AD914E7|nr:THO complex subunit 3 [Rosa chinensis]
MEKTTPFKNLLSREYGVHEKEVRSVAWNFTGTKLASGSEDQTARVWHIEPHGNGNSVELKGHRDSVEHLCWDPKHAELVATASMDKTVRLWDDRTGKCVQLAELSGLNINIAYKPDGELIAVGDTVCLVVWKLCCNNELTILDVRTFKAIHKRKFHCEVNEIAWNTTSDILFVTTGKDEKGVVEVLSYPSLQPLDRLMAHTAGCHCIAIDPCGRYFAVGSADALVSLWDISELLCVRTFTKIKSAVRTISFNHSGEYLASGSTDCFIDISNVQTGRTVHQIPCGPAMNSVDWNPKSNLLAYAGKDNINEGIVRIFGFTSTG